MAGMKNPAVSQSGTIATPIAGPTFRISERARRAASGGSTRA